MTRKRDSVQRWAILLLMALFALSFALRHHLISDVLVALVAIGTLIVFVDILFNARR